MKRKANDALFESFLEGLKQVAPVVWLSDRKNRPAQTAISQEGIKVQTIHSAKGLQYRAVILMWADELPGKFQHSDPELDRRLLYVALTRPEDFLAVTCSGPSPFVEVLERSGRIQVLE